MAGRLKLAVLTMATVGFSFGQVASVQAQEAGGRFRVLIPYFEPLEGADDDLGGSSLKIAGLIITAVFVSQGSSFWYDILKKIK